MRVLHLAAGNRWTGAAAPAFAEVEALRAAGVDAHFAYVGGYRLEAKIGHLSFAHPLIEKAQNPRSFATTVRALRDLDERYGFDVLHAHLTHDHWLARFAAGGRARVARTFHSRRTLRRDPLTRMLLRRSRALFVINEGFLDAPLLRDRDAVFTPPPVDHRQFRPDGGNVRARYGIAADVPLVVVIGKVAKGRGFELALQTLATLRRTTANAQMMIIGHGEHRPALESLAAELGVAANVIWAGYHEEDLAEHYRAGDALLFTARGSDEGHRAVLEAMACGLSPVAAPLEGVGALLRGFEARCIAAAVSAEALAARAIPLLAARDASLRHALVDHSQQFGFRAAAERLVRDYHRAIPSVSEGPSEVGGAKA